MPNLTSILQANDTLVYFVYGQVFFSLGLAIALHSRQRSRLELARQLTWLAAFGFTHGLHEWAHVFIPIQATYLPPASVGLLNVARLATLALSFFFLGQFGALVTLPNRRLQQLCRAAFGVLLAGWLVWALALASVTDATSYLAVESWARRVMGLSASILAAIGMLRQARAVAKLGLNAIARDFLLAALSFGAYAFLVGLVVPLPDPLAAQWPAYRLKAEFLGIPAPVLRSLAGLGIVLGIVRGLRIFELETDRRLEEAEQARLNASERARAAMESMAATISEQHDLGDLVKAALKQIATLAGSPAGWLMLVHQESGKLEMRGSYGLEPEATENECGRNGHCDCGKILATGLASAFASGSHCYRRPAGALDRGMVGVPLLAQGRAIGVIHLVGGDFEPELLAILTSLGRQLGLAVENARLAEEVARTEAARAQLLKKVIAAQEEERRRVARDLHDQTGQSLTAVIMTLGAASERMERNPRQGSALVQEAREIAVQGLESTRELIMGLRPSVLDDLGLVPALRRLAEDLDRKGSVKIGIEADGLARRLPIDVEIVLFRILQEGLQNVLRHSRASRATVQLERDAEEVRAEVIDNGVGFDLAEATAHLESGRGLGLLGMKERAGLLEGEVAVETAPGRGTRLRVRIPLR
ncbi:MAG: GAF domain-containing sensor histidine kinase [Chloroflexota bacterium]